MKKKLLSLFVALAMCITLIVGCNNSDDNKKPSGDDEPEVPPTTTPVQLTAPTVTLTDNVISWSAVENASGYTVYEGETAVSTAQTQLKYTIEKTESGSWTYTVVAVSGDTTKYTNSNASNEVTYTYTKPEEKPEDKPSVDTSTKLTGNIYLVGDSTVCSFTDAYYMPRYGYGTQLYNYINCDATQIKNLAQSGRSSYSFTKEGNYQTLISSIGEGDYLIIGFGHNDEKCEVARYTDPNLESSDTSTMIGGYNTEREVSFKRVLKKYYIDVAVEKGATPILCTPITRLFEDSKKDKYDSVHVTTTQTAKDDNSGVTTEWKGGDYVKAIKELAEEEKLLCIDLTSITKADYKQLGYAKASKYHAATGAKWTNAEKTEKEATGIDATHTNLYGAKMNSYYIADAIKSSDLALKANVRTNIAKPVYADNATAIINDKYNIPDKEPFNPTKDVSAYWKNIDGITKDTTTQTEYNWYATAFGKYGDKANFTITQGSDENGLTFTLKETTSKGKIESSNDSMAAVFIQLPFKTAFNITATAKVTTYGGKQAGFGIMLRDDIYIDQMTDVNSNYVAAGCYGTSTGAIVGYARKDGALVQSSNKNITITNGNTYDLSIARSSQSITAKMGNYTYNAESDFDLAVSDSEYVYVCLWVVRGTEVTFSNINFASNVWTQA